VCGVGRQRFDFGGHDLNTICPAQTSHCHLQGVHASLAPIHQGERHFGSCLGNDQPRDTSAGTKVNHPLRSCIKSVRELECVSNHFVNRAITQGAHTLCGL
jgi:hypothetical protein